MEALSHRTDSVLWNERWGQKDVAFYFQDGNYSIFLSGSSRKSIPGVWELQTYISGVWKFQSITDDEKTYIIFKLTKALTTPRRKPLHEIVSQFSTQLNNQCIILYSMGFLNRRPKQLPFLRLTLFIWARQLTHWRVKVSCCVAASHVFSSFELAAEFVWGGYHKS